MSLAGRGTLAGSAAVVAMVIVAVVYSRQGAPRESSLVLWESFSWSAFNGSAGRLERQLREAGARHRIEVDLLVLGPRREPREALRERLTRGRYDGVVLGPLAALEAAAFATEFPAVHFTALSLLDEPPAGTPRSNTTTVYLDRSPAYLEAGRRLAADHGVTRVGVLAAVTSPRAPLEAFGNGLMAERADTEVRETVISPLHDRVQIRRAVEDFADAGVQAVLLSLGAQNSYALEVCEDEGLQVVAPNWGWSRPRPGSVLLSIDDDLVGGLEAAWSASGEHGSVAAGAVIREVREPLGAAGWLAELFGRLTRGRD